MKINIVLCVLTLFVFSMDMSAASVSKEAALQKALSFLLSKDRNAVAL